MSEQTRPVSEDDRLGAMLGRTSVHPQGQEYGLSKRELFALVSMHAHRVGLIDEDAGQIAMYAIADADALLKELARG